MFVSLKTDGYVQAVQKANVFLRTPNLNPTHGLSPDIEAFPEHQQERQLFTAATAAFGTSQAAIRFLTLSNT